MSAAHATRNCVLQRLTAVQEMTKLPQVHPSTGFTDKTLEDVRGLFFLSCTRRGGALRKKMSPK